MKIEDKLGLSWAKLSRWAKLSHPNSIELRLTGVSRISCSFKSQTELVCYIKCIFNKCRTRRSGGKESHCRFSEQEWVILSIILTIWWTSSIFTTAARWAVVVIESKSCLIAWLIDCLICPLFPIAQLKPLGISSWRVMSSWSSRRSKQ